MRCTWILDFGVISLIHIGVIEVKIQLVKIMILTSYQFLNSGSKKHTSVLN